MLEGCATIPAEATALSAELGGRIKESRTTHEALVHLFMNEKRATVDRFITSEWIPLFAKQLFERPNVQAAWEEVVRKNDPVVRLEFIKGLGPRLQAEINNKRSELVKPLNEMEQGIIRGLEDHYNQMLAMNSTVTGILASAQQASERQQEILKGLGLQTPLREVLDKAEEVTELLTAGLNSYEKNKDKIDKIVNTVKTRM
jgi:hypothetical protein